MKITYYVANSEDGFIARDNGDVSWFDNLDIDINDTGYDAFYASIDGLVMGRNTYHFIFDYGSWPYDTNPSWVISSRPLEKRPAANLFTVSSIEAFVSQASAQQLQHIWLVGGGQLASHLVDKGLLNNIIISEMPVKPGSGIPLFSHHQVDELPAEKTNTFQKKGFKQIEISL